MQLLSKISTLVWLSASSAGTAYGQVIWSDEFDSGTSPDPAVWSYDIGAGGWGNEELQEYTNAPENVRIENGNLVITARETTAGENGRGFTSARVRTEDKLTFKYGRIEARIKIPDLADGLWPAFWTLGNDFSQVGWPFCGELDVMEMGNSAAISAGFVNQYVGSTAHWEDNGNTVFYGETLYSPTRLDDGFHIFSMNWTPSLVTTYLDGEQIWAFNIRPDSCTDCSEFHQPHFMILNMAVGGTYPGLLSSDQITAAMPAEMLIDYVRIYDNGFTELGGSSVQEEPVVGLEYSGSWYNSGQSGHGFSMEFGKAADGSPTAVVYWYTYDTLGNPIFLVGQGVQTENALELEFVSPYGMDYGEFDPDSVVRESGGTARFDFSDPDHATFSYTPSEFSVSAWGHTPIDSLPLTKLFAIPVSGTGNQ